MKETQTTVRRGATRHEWVSAENAQVLVLLALTAAGVYLCFKLAAPFLGALAWALTLAVVFAPLQRRIEARLRRPSLSALCTLTIIVVVVMLPLGLITQRLVAEAADGTTVVKAKIESGEWTRAIENHPRLEPVGRWISDNTNLPGALGAGMSWLATQGGSLLRGSVIQVVTVALTFYFLFFFLRDRNAAMDAARKLTPLSRESLQSLWNRIADTIYATVYGTVAVAVAQGVLGGLLFWSVGLPSPLLWGLVMGLLAIVPMLGPFLVWVPAAIYLAATGSWGKAMVLTVGGAVVVGGVDNLLRPLLVGNRLKLHTLVMFVAVLGGLSVFGASGLIWGPIVVTTTLWLFERWRARIGAAPRS